MSRYNASKQLIESSSFIKKPVDKICTNIKNSKSKKIILTGGRGTGKSIVLVYDELNDLNTDNRTIYMRFDSVGIFSSSRSIFDETFYRHYYEIIMCHKLLDYTKNHINVWSSVYEDNFRNIEEEFINYTRKLDNYINHSLYKDITLDKYLTTGELSSQLLDRIKKVFNISSLNIAIDRFDWTNSNSATSQQILSSYFDMFDKVIITSDDEKLLSKNNRKTLEKQGYKFVDVNYGKNQDVVTSIVQNRVLTKPKSSITNIFEKSLNENIYENLTNKANGNINLIINTVDYVYDIYGWYDAKCNVEEEFDKAVSLKIEENKELKKMIKPPKLYL